MLAKRLVILLLVFFCSVPLWAQMTTSSIKGRVINQEGEAIDVVVVTATHIPSGTDYYALTNDDGYYSIDGMRPGGPYIFVFSCLGYKSAKYEGINLELAEVFSLGITMEESIESLEAALIVTEHSSHFSSDQMGATTNINSKQISSIPTEERTITEITRLSPYGGNGMNIAGGNGRTINFTVDGANFNNNLGLGDKIPGGGNPISIEALAEVQVVVSPYDVRQNNFNTAGINSVTKSGTNTFQGNVYYNVNDSRKSVSGLTFGGPIIKNKLFFFANFESTNTPKDVNKWRASDKGLSSTSTYISRTKIVDLELVSDFVKDKYGYDPGSFWEYPSQGTNIKFLSRIDWNINRNNKLSLRYNHTYNRAWNTANGTSVDGAALLSKARSSDASMIYANSMFAKDSYVSTWSLNLNSRISNNFHNEFHATYSHIDDRRVSNSEPFPFVDILKADEVGVLQNYISLGYELFSQNNHSYNNVLTIKNDLTYYISSHKITAGVNLESQVLFDAYMRNGNGYYQYWSIGDFLTGGAPLAVCLTYGYDGESDPGAFLRFNNYSAYLQDEWSIGDRFKLNYGLRYEAFIFNDKDLKRNGLLYNIDYSGNGFHIVDGKTYTPDQEALARRIDTSRWPNQNHTISPRIGFTWDVFGNKSLKIRGGTGVFSGRIPLVLLLNMPTNSGTIQQQTILNGTGLYNAQIADMSLFEGGLKLDANGKATKEALRDFIVANGFGPKSYEDNQLPSLISAVDPNFKMPQTWKTTLAVDYTFPTSFPLSITAEMIYNKTITDVLVRDWSIKDYTQLPAFEGPDKRPFYSATHQYDYVDGKHVPNAFVLSNTNQGYGYLFSFTVKTKPFDALDIKLSYTFNEVYTLSDLPNDELNSVIPYIPTVKGFNHTELHPSPNVLPHRVLCDLSFKINAESSLSLIYDASLGKNRYSYMIANDMNGDGYQYDLLYIPNSKEELHFSSEADRYRFWEFLNKNEYLSKHKGEYAEGYALISPWFNLLDLRYTHNIKLNIGKDISNSIQFTVDVKNLLNIIRPNWGVEKVFSSSINNGRILKYEGVDLDNYPIYSMPESITEDSKIWVPMDYSKKYWGIQFGLKYLFN